MRDVMYTPRSMTHIDFGWHDAYTDATDSLAKRDLLIRGTYLTKKENSVFEDNQGNTYRGMFINYDFVSERLKVSRRKAQEIVNELIDDGYFIKHQLKNNHILVEASPKALTLSTEMHEFSLAAKTHPDEYEEIAKHFKVVYVSQPELQAQQILPNLEKSDDKPSRFCQALYKEEKINKKITVNNNQYQVLETETQFENADCLTVVFYFDDFGLGEIAAESELFDYFTSAQSQILSTIVYCHAACLDIRVFNETLTRQDLRKAAQSFRQLVDWAYTAAIGDQAKNIASNQDLQSMLNEVTITSNDQNSVESNMVDFKACDTDHQGVSDEASTTQTNGGSVKAYNNTADIHHGKIISTNQACETTNNSTTISTSSEITETQPSNPAPNSNTVDLVGALKAYYAEHPEAIDKDSVTQTNSDSGNEVGYNTARRDHGIKQALQQSLPSKINTGNVDLDMLDV